MYIDFIKKYIYKYISLYYKKISSRSCQESGGGGGEEAGGRIILSPLKAGLFEVPSRPVYSKPPPGLRGAHRPNYSKSI